MSDSQKMGTSFLQHQAPQISLGELCLKKILLQFPKLPVLQRNGAHQ